MPVSRLPNYLRMHRKRMGLSQDQVASILGCRSGAKVSRYERFQREPTLRTAIACEVLFGVSIRELFAGVYEEIERAVERRARTLARRLAAERARDSNAAA